MLINISELQDKLLLQYEDCEPELHEIPMILQKTHENVAALIYFAQKIEQEIRNKICVPDTNIDMTQVIASGIIEKRVSEALDVLCEDVSIHFVVDVSVDVILKDTSDIYINIVPIYQNDTSSI